MGTLSPHRGDKMNEKAKFGFLAYLLDRLGENRYYGLIVTQKIVYFLQEAFDVPLPYQFYFYHFGPYDDTLDRDLRMMKGFGLINIGDDPPGAGYSIQVNEDAANESMQEAGEFIESNKPKIDQLLELFGEYTPSELELTSTIHFVWKNNKNGGTETQLREVVVKKVGKLKPKFSQEEIERKYDYLVEQRMIRHD